MNNEVIIPLSEGIFTIGFDKIFHPFNPEVDELNSRSTGSLLVEVQPFLIHLNNEFILLDTGLGFKNEQGELQIHANLRKNGIEPTQVNKVILSHLHKDHAGGIGFNNELGIHQLSFPNATYYVNKHEFEYALEKGSPSYVIEDFEMLTHSPQVEWLDDKGKIGEFIMYEVYGGHCPYHMGIKIELPEGILFFGGDIAPQLKQLKTKYIAKYDFDGKKSMELRQQFAEQAKQEDWTFLFYHDVKLPFSKLN